MGRHRSSPSLRALPLLLATLAAWGLGCHAADGPPPSRPPNLVLLSVDTLVPGELRAFDPSAQALPHLDRFADGAIRFTHAFTPASWTLPAHASLLTGLSLQHHGAVHPDVGIVDSVPTLAETLSAAGYRTIGFTHGGFLRADYGFARGFDLYDGQAARSARLPSFVLPRGGRVPEVRGEDLFDRAIAFLEAQNGSAPPFFLFVHTYNVHDYFKVNPWVREPDDPDGPAKEDHYLSCLLGFEECSEDEWHRLRRYYRAEIRHLDDGLGRLLGALEAHVDGPTYVMLVSDHGEGFDPEHGRTHHGGRLHDDVIRVPILLSGPDQTARTVDAPVSLIDVAPTLLELAGVDPPAGLDGRSLLAPAEPGRALFASEYTTVCRDGTLVSLAEPTDRPLSVAVISGDLRLITHREGNELYDLASDPSELDDLAASRADLLAPLLRQATPLLRLRLSLRLLAGDDARSKELRALGYL